MARRASRLAGGTAAVRTGGGDTARPRDGIITGYLLKLIRQSAGLSQEGLAEQVGVDSNTVQGWETGRRSLTGTRVATLVELRASAAAARRRPAAPWRSGGRSRGGLRARLYARGGEPRGRAGCSPACVLGTQAVVRLSVGLAVHGPASHRTPAASGIDSPRSGRAGSCPNPGGAVSLLRAPPPGGRAIAERQTAQRGKGDAASPQCLLLAVVESEQRGDGLAG
jgi:DNA-binding XRE family transcriptional regulator